MRQIWKFHLRVTDFVSVAMPGGAKILSVQMQGDKPCIWALVDPDSPSEQRTFRWIGTGHPIKDYQADRMKFIGTVQSGEFVFHLFEE